ncbi:transposase [Roseomonas sp. OT10]|uniref:transposase n=1 Tax=Roseomonas cutis TaxID=2897332 RepID=UPI001E4A5E17|nr:transposase [Roseomonas sp. OT10]UFN50656.1 transposase [Roseomonas sp. OT10]
MPFLPHTSRLSPPTPWSPLSDAAWAALLPHLARTDPRGRPVHDLRARMDAIFHAALSRAPWAALPPRFGNPDTVARHFRRLTHAGLWQRLLLALAEADPSHPLRAIEHAICRACRRAARLLGFPFLVLIRRLGLRSALDGPPWLLPDPLLSETLARTPIPDPDSAPHGQCGPLRALLATLKHLHRTAAGRARIPRSVRWGWP